MTLQELYNYGLLYITLIMILYKAFSRDSQYIIYFENKLIFFIIIII